MSSLLAIFRKISYSYYRTYTLKNFHFVRRSKPVSNPIFSSFWDNFKIYITYESYIDSKIANPLFVTKTGQKPVGGIFSVGKGSLVLLPPVRYDEDNFTEYDEEDEECWTEEAVKFGNKFIKTIIDIDKALRSETKSTPLPQWGLQKDYTLSTEKKLKSQIEKSTTKINKLISKKVSLLNELEKELLLKGMLFEKGKRLEKAILDGLNILGYRTENYDDGELEIDQVIVSPEGDRFIGESEGKDNSAVNIDKLRQLSSNIHEDLQRKDINEPAIGILFGNGFRLKEPKKRPEQFTKKCINTNKTFNYILIKTIDLFTVAKYIKDSSNKTFAKKCREVIKKSKGQIVIFPKPPAKTDKKINLVK